MNGHRAAQLVAPARFEIVDVAGGELAHGELAIAVEGCGVCGSNLPVWQGRPWFQYPLPPGRPGHEGWGVVEAVGGPDDMWRPGQRVTFLAEDAFAERIHVPVDRAVALPASLGDAPFPGEAFGCAFNATRRAAITAGQTVVVVGFGFLGAVIAALAAHAGAVVIACNRGSAGLDAARSLGVEHTVEMNDTDVVIRDVLAITGGFLADVVVEAGGAQATLDVASALTRVHGRLVIAGYHQDGPRTVDMQEWNWRGIDVINAHERDPIVALRGIGEAVDAVAAGWLDPRPFVTHSLPLSRINDAVQLMVDRPDRFLKAVVTP
ncbi:MAG: threonine dehydrogenase [Ilumatobacteraceae bacterium]|nr:threonine dehydrogenase [Ilumatobacteraceae bacterium]